LVAFLVDPASRLRVDYRQQRSAGRGRSVRLFLGAEVHPRRCAAVEAIVGQVAVGAWVHLLCAMLRTLIKSESVGVFALSS